ncbi:MFS transporter [Agromyces aurantiacus]|uniref:MFS transporter n=1 Tax=Agromyces aurantiacus TaxID=165814 RepID=A0ABV9R2H5_9MICO|nr:MFS transporter [Agromyces aurantiacus]MBM7505880.1 EmrB/QacA subfamily drug resistance transporter [Agromyces aurantiacus]
MSQTVTRGASRPMPAPTPGAAAQQTAAPILQPAAAPNLAPNPAPIAAAGPSSRPSTSARTAPTSGPGPSDRRRWAALAVLALAQFLVVLDASIVNIAIPAIGADLALGPGALAWVITAYVLPFGSLLLIGGRLADRFGHRRLFLAGVAGFVLASAAAAFAPDGAVLLGARAAQGAAAALLAPAALALVARIFTTAADRARALGIWGAVAGIGSAVGVLLGGVLTASFGWPAVFLVNLPVGAIVLVAVPFLVARDRRGAVGRLDLPGAAAATGALVALVGALTAVEQLGFAHPLVAGLAAAAVALGALFVVIERRAPEPLVPASVFRNRSVLVGNVVMLLLGGAMVALFFALSVFLQAAMGLDALAAGLTQLPLAGTLVVVAGLVPALVARFGARPVLVAALMVLAAGTVWLGLAPAGADFVRDILGPTVLIGVGLGAAFVTTTELAVHGVDGGEAGVAGGLVNTAQQIGGALGLAALGTLATLRTDALAEAGLPADAATAGGLSVAFLGTAVLAVAAAVVVVIVRRRRSGAVAGA